MSRAFAASVAESRWRQRVTLRRMMELQVTQKLSKVDAAAQAIHELTGEPLERCREYVDGLRQQGNRIAEMVRESLQPKEGAR